MKHFNTKACVRIRIVGASPQELVNALGAASVAFWGIEKQDEFTWFISMYAADYLNIRRKAQRAMCRVRVVKRWGLPFAAKRLRRRPALLAGIAVLTAAVIILPMFIWKLEVQGNSTVPTEKILRELEEINVGIGTFGASVHPAEIKNKMLLKIPELSWLTVNVSGGRAVVIVRERDSSPQVQSADMVTDLVANNSGIITEMEVLKGQEQVKSGQTVLAGEVLVKGSFELKVNDEVFAVQNVRSAGAVYALCWEKLTAVIPLQYSEKIYTGKEKVKTALIFGKKKINLYFNSSYLYDECDKITKRIYLTLPGGIVLPLGLECVTEKEYTTEASELSEEQAQKLLEDYLIKSIKANTPQGEILESKFETKAGDGVLQVAVICRCREQIAEERPADITEPITDTKELQHGTDN